MPQVWDDEAQGSAILCADGALPVIDVNAIEGCHTWCQAPDEGGAYCNLYGDIGLQRMFDNGPSLLDSCQVPDIVGAFQLG